MQATNWTRYSVVSSLKTSNRCLPLVKVLKSYESGMTLVLIVLSTLQDWLMPFMSYMLFKRRRKPQANAM